MNVVTKKICVLIIDVRKYSTERHMAGFHGGFLFTNVCECIFVCITVQDCRQN